MPGEIIRQEGERIVNVKDINGAVQRYHIEEVKENKSKTNEDSTEEINEPELKVTEETKSITEQKETRPKRNVRPPQRYGFET